MNALERKKFQHTILEILQLLIFITQQIWFTSLVKLPGVGNNASQIKKIANEKF
jgi:hypothetical protein